ncbi:alpha/beta fold hydrolase [Hymenobacter wooponensis]|uniref:Alpha/beta hydrolase n=1 Tax=Hymenobacter wooponensis TaxID=1525360 RepID=A0A4Z0MHT7_9BACT|nr:alpha/beta hydrolase [Hymenobacter wooponensis]TGD78755.1 alpha/beta hydrolase [Hymenobacter wooponensis]
MQFRTVTFPSSLTSGQPFANQPLEALEYTHPLLQRNKVRVIGSGDQVLLFCHGFGCSQQIWRYLTTSLATRYKLVLFDYVGSGESDLQAYEPVKYSSLDGYAQDIVDICQVLNLRDVVLVGHSIGATIAMLAAIQEPSYFSKIIMLAPSPCYTNEPGYHGGFDREDILQLLQLMDADYTSWANMFATILMGARNESSLGEELAGFFCNTDPQIAKQFATTAFLADNRAEVPLLTIPTLILQCSQDAVAPEEVGEFLHTHLPQSTLVKLQATGHCPHLSAPLETLKAMDAFLSAN